MKQSSGQATGEMKEKMISPIIAGKVAEQYGIQKGFKELERIGTTILEVNKQVILLEEQILAREFHFDEKQLNRFRNLIKQGLLELEMLTREQHHPLDLKEIDVVVDLAKDHYGMLMAKDMNFLLPDKKQAQKIISETTKHK